MNDKRLIDANIKVTLQTYDDMYEEHRTETLTIAEVLDGFADEGCPPTIDAVEVVRCRECEYRGDELKCPMCFDEWDEDEPGFLRIDKTVDDGFCHMGAKMDGGAEGV